MLIPWLRWVVSEVPDAMLGEVEQKNVITSIVENGHMAQPGTPVSSATMDANYAHLARFDCWRRWNEPASQNQSGFVCELNVFIVNVEIILCW